jgi:transcriptional regulator with XRE-family HTH domain
MRWQTLNKRRLGLGMSIAALACRSKVSLPTVQRILSGKAPLASIANLLAIASALGVRFEIQMKPALEVRRQQAMEKARKLVGMVQPTSALEGQAVVEDVVKKMVARTARELLAAGKRSLWSERWANGKACQAQRRSMIFRSYWSRESTPCGS